jgi:hypothetical protein
VGIYEEDPPKDLPVLLQVVQEQSIETTLHGSMDKSVNQQQIKSTVWQIWGKPWEIRPTVFGK